MNIFPECQQLDNDRVCGYVPTAQEVIRELQYLMNLRGSGEWEKDKLSDCPCDMCAGNYGQIRTVQVGGEIIQIKNTRGSRAG